MIKTPGNEALYFCCALGLERGPKLSRMTPGSQYVESGYTGIAGLLNAQPNDTERLSTVNIFYKACYLVLIVDEPDKLMDYFVHSLATTQQWLEKAEIQHIVRTDHQISTLITGPEVNVLPVVFEKRKRRC